MRAGAILVLSAAIAGCTPEDPASEVRELTYSLDGGERHPADTMSKVRGVPANRIVEVWLDAVPPAHCNDPALLLTNATLLDAAELDGRPADVLRRPYGLLPLQAGRTVPAHLVLKGRVERAQGRLLIGCGRDLVTRWLLLDVVQFVVGGVLLVGALFAATAAMSRRMRPTFGWLALFLLATGWVCWAQSPGFRNLLFVRPIWVSWLRDACAFLYTAAFARWIAAAFGDTRRRLFNGVAWVTLAIAIVGVALDVARVVGLRSTFVVSQVLVVALLPAAIAHVIPRARLGDRSARRFLAGTFALLLFSAPDLAWGLGLPLHFEFNLAPVGLLMLAASLGSIAQLHFEERSAALERTNDELEARLKELEGKQREVQGLSGELRHQIGRRSQELGLALLRDPTLQAVGIAKLSPGHELGRYRVIRELGAGAMGAVYEVERTSDGEHLALKVMSAAGSSSLAARFAREAEIAAQVQHPNVVGISDIDVLPSGVPFLVMELVRGGSLEDQRSRFGDVAWALGVLPGLAAALEALHAASVVHRDLKPSNVLLDERGAVKVADFGIARQQDTSPADTLAASSGPEQEAPRSRGPGASTPHTPPARLTHTGALIGTPLYMAPELGLGGVAAPSTDVFAFGLIAYELLCGSHPFQRPPVLLAMAGAPLPAVPPIDRDGVPEPVCELVMASLAADPERRPSARMLALALASHS